MQFGDIACFSKIEKIDRIKVKDIYTIVYVSLLWEVKRLRIDKDSTSTPKPLIHNKKRGVGVLAGMDAIHKFFSIFKFIKSISKRPSQYKTTLQQPGMFLNLPSQYLTNR